MKKLFMMTAMLFAVCAASAQDKMSLCVDNFTNNTSYNEITVKNLRNEIVAGITATGRLTMVDVNTLGELPTAMNERVKVIGEKGINYILTGTLNSIEEKTSQSDNKTKYQAEINFTLTVIDAETGANVASETMKESWYSGETRDEAILKAIEEAKGKMKKFVDNNFKLEATVKALDQVDDKKGAKTVYVTIGSDAGVQKGQIFEVFAEVNVAGENVRKKIGELKAKEVMSGTMTLCDVKNGGKEIKAAFENGTKMSVVTRASRSIWDHMDKVMDKI